MSTRKKAQVHGYFFQDGPCTFQRKEEQLIDELATARGIPMEWLDARSANAGPYVLRFTVTELPTLVLHRSLANQLSSTVILEGADLRNPRTLTKWLDKLLPR